ncbi:MAG TPA: hypothetical protein VLR91_03700, partial [Thermodesulfobacteriota bacterium]|nr:hypothetical protein [Thermodesulfobacteriota bacterium]
GGKEAGSKKKSKIRGQIMSLLDDIDHSFKTALKSGSTGTFDAASVKNSVKESTSSRKTFFDRGRGHRGYYQSSKTAAGLNGGVQTCRQKRFSPTRRGGITIPPLFFAPAVSTGRNTTATTGNNF